MEILTSVTSLFGEDISSRRQAHYGGLTLIMKVSQLSYSDELRRLGENNLSFILLFEI